MKRVVNGMQVDLTQAEIEARNAEESAWASGSIERTRQAALREIDAKAGAVRGRYITVAPGQEATYLLKASAAEAYTAAGYAGSIPALVQAEATVTNRTAAQAAAAILAERDAWVGKAAQIEQARRAGKIAVAAASTVEDLAAARGEAIAALEQL